MRELVIALVASLAAAPALAQLDPSRPSPSEQRVQSLNRSMLNDQQGRAAAQQNQFEVNSLRNELSRPVAPAPSIAAPIR